MKRLAKNLQKTSFFFLFTFFLFLSPVFSMARAQGGAGAATPEMQKMTEANIAAQQTGAPSKANFDGSTLSNAMTAGTCNIVDKCSCLGADECRPGAAYSFSNAIVALYTPPATTGEYIADVMNSAGITLAKPAYAQGLGFASLNPILETWKVFRNLAYLFYVILFLVIGFMIMFRRKVNTQAAVTAQQALPNIIVSLVAVTFSYAIAGLLIDGMYLVMFLIVGLFQAQFANIGINLQDWAMNQNIFAIGFKIFQSGITVAAGSSAGSAIQELVKSALTGTFIEGLAGGVGFISGVTFALIFSLALLFGIFSLFFELLKTYVSIVIAIILSPLALMLGALPGNNAIQSWLKALIANLAAFPVVLIMIIFAYVIGGQTTGNTSISTGGFIPPYLIGYGEADAIRALLSMAVILIMPGVVQQVKKMLGGSGGIFEQFASNFQSAVSKGWKGGELVPGLGFTKVWGAKDIAQKSTIVGAGAGAAAAAAAAPGIFVAPGTRRLEAAGMAFKGTTKFMGNLMKDKTFGKEEKKKTSP